MSGPLATHPQREHRGPVLRSVKSAYETFSGLNSAERERLLVEQLPQVSILPSGFMIGSRLMYCLKT